MIKIRLKRIGRQRVNVFRIIVTHVKRQRDTTNILADIGYYQPQNKKVYCKMDLDKYEAWIKRGAVPTVRVVKLRKVMDLQAQQAQQAQPTSAQESQV